MENRWALPLSFKIVLLKIAEVIANDNFIAKVLTL